MRLKLKKWQVISGLVVLGLIIYLITRNFILYCNDAYVRGNLIAIAPRVTGNVVQILVQNNQYVHQGDVLIKIDPIPFELEAAQASAQLKQAQQQLSVLNVQLKAYEQELNVTQEQLNLSDLTLKRYKNLAKKGAVAEQLLTDKEDAQRAALNAFLIATSNVTRTQQQIAVQEAAITDAEHKLALANYQLSYTTIVAPTNGYINNLYIYPGSHAVVNEPLFGLLQEGSLQVIANYKESYLANIKPGQTVWVMASSHWWHFYRGKVVSYGRAVARNDSSGNAALPYIQPTTDWIRYPYRFPITIALEDVPHDAPIAMGADAYTWILA